jgi:hypothetical protein
MASAGTMAASVSASVACISSGVLNADWRVLLPWRGNFREFEASSAGTYFCRRAKLNRLTICRSMFQAGRVGVADAFVLDEQQQQRKGSLMVPMEGVEPTRL